MSKFRRVGAALAVCAGCMALAACSSEAEEVMSEEQVIRLTSCIAPADTRGTDLTQQATQIAQGQSVGVTITGGKSTHDNVQWTVGTNGELTSTSTTPIVYHDNQTATITAYHPHTDYGSTPFSFTVQKDQTGNGYLNSDLLWAKATATKQKEAVNLTFEHKLAKVNVTLTSQLSGATVFVCGTKPITTFNPSTGEIGSASGDTIHIRAGVTTKNAYTATAIVVPQTVKNGTAFIKVVEGENTYYQTLDSDLVLESGKSYSFSVGVLTASQKETTFYVGTAGNLESILGEKKSTLTSITVAGPLNGTDYKCLREMVSSNKLTELDLSGTSVVAGGDAYYTNSGTSYTTEDNVFPKYVFYNCSNLTSITLPESVTSLGWSAFYGCSSLTDITIPKGVTSIGSRAFYGCSNLTNITIPEGVTTIGSRAFYNCKSLTSITIPKGVTYIGEWEFSGCSSLTSITIPNGVTSIAGSAFRDCSSLTSIDIPNGVTSIGSEVFYGCKSLTSITIPNGVTTISNYTFYGCKSLTSITLPGSVTSIGSRAFYGCSNLTSIDIPDGVTSIGEYAFHGCGLTSIEIPKGVTTINNHTFYSCESLTSVILPESVTSIGTCAFYNCSTLTNINIPKSVTIIGTYGFGCCYALTSITIPESVTTIGNLSFYNCVSLTSINIPEGVTSILASTFENCKSLTSINIPKNVTSIGNEAFYNCSQLSEIHCKITDPANVALGSDIFYNVDKANCTLYVPTGSKTSYKAADVWKEFTNIVEE